MTNNTSAKFKQIYEKYFDPLCRQAYRILFDAEESRDCVQEVFLNLWNKNKDIKIHTDLENYLYRSVKNTAISIYRKKKVAQNKEQELSSNYSFLKKKDLLSSEDQLIISNSLNCSINSLKPKMREIFIFHYKNGLTYKEISEVLNIPKRTVEDNIYRAYTIIKNKLNDNKDFMSSKYLMDI